MRLLSILGGYDGSRKAEIVTSSIFLICAVGGFIAVPQLVSGWAFVMPGTTDSALTPTFFPRLAMVLLSLTSVCVLFSAAARTDVIPLVEMTREDWKRVGTIFGLILLFFLGLRLIGFVPAATLFIAAVALLLGYKRVMIVGAVAIAGSVLIAVVFRYGLKVQLPSGLI
jgi:putative tricarboxylic transport membrane protein